MPFQEVIDSNGRSIQTGLRFDSETPTPGGPEPDWAEWQPNDPRVYTNSRGGRTVDTVVMHFTAGGPSYRGTVNYLLTNPHKISCHYVIGKDGELAHMVALDRKANHAGDSMLEGRRYVNSRSVGIEIINWGPLTKEGSRFKTYIGSTYSGPTPIEATNRDGSRGYWEPFTEAQYEATIRLTRFLLQRILTVRFVTGHEDICNPVGRKIDPGPGFDWARIERALRPSFRGHVGPILRNGQTQASVAGGTSPAAGRQSRQPLPSSDPRVARNVRYASTLGWQSRIEEINVLVGLPRNGGNDARFADAVANWQRANRLSSDGLLGPNTWRRMQSALVQLKPPAAVPHVQGPLPLQGSVGRGGRNRAQDAILVKKRLIGLGFDWLKPDGRVDEETIRTIRLFQSIKAGRQNVGGDGRIDVRGDTHRWLEATNAPRWQRMSVGSRDQGFHNAEVVEQTWDNHDYGTDWLDRTIREAAFAYRKGYLRAYPNAALLTVDDVSVPRGGDTPDHGGHETGLDVDLRLPRTDGTAPGQTDINHRLYDQKAMRAMLLALKSRPLVTRVFFNDQALIQEGLCTYSRNHHHHVHFGISPPPRASES